ncbi:MAG: histidine triad nucleotide-binding protein [Cocleimonas sp.]|nr:histidine triad nucleotide-binding protein [Cocleimonas sp.]
MSDCLFCKIIAGEIPSEKVYEDDHVYAFKDITPVAPLHMLIIPKKHIATINDLESDDAETMGNLFLAAKKIAKHEGYDEAGYRTVMNCGEAAGQTVFHVHLHLLAGRDLSWPPG